MALTLDQFKALPFGYLTGSDLALRCPSVLLIKQYELDADGFTTGVATAIAQIKAAGINYYDMATELALTGGARALDCVRIAAMLAVANVMGSAQAIGEKLAAEISQARKDLLAIRMGQYQLPLHPPPCQTDPTSGKPVPYPASDAKLVCSSFSTLG